MEPKPERLSSGCSPEPPNSAPSPERNDAGEGSRPLFTLFDIHVFFNKTDASVTANSLKKKPGFIICTKDGDWCGSDLLPQIQDPELVQVVEAGFDHASPEVASVQVHDGCGGQRAQVRVDSDGPAAPAGGTPTGTRILGPVLTLPPCPVFRGLEARLVIPDSWAACDITPRGPGSRQVYDLGRPI